MFGKLLEPEAFFYSKCLIVWRLCSACGGAYSAFQTYYLDLRGPLGGREGQGGEKQGSDKGEKENGSFSIYQQFLDPSLTGSSLQRLPNTDKLKGRLHSALPTFARYLQTFFFLLAHSARLRCFTKTHCISSLLLCHVMLCYVKRCRCI